MEMVYILPLYVMTRTDHSRYAYTEMFCYRGKCVNNSKYFLMKRTAHKSQIMVEKFPNFRQNLRG